MANTLHLSNKAGRVGIAAIAAFVVALFAVVVGFAPAASAETIEDEVAVEIGDALCITPEGACEEEVVVELAEALCVTPEGACAEAEAVAPVVAASAPAPAAPAVVEVAQPAEASNAKLMAKLAAAAFVA